MKDITKLLLPKYDNASFNVTGSISYWINDIGIKVNTSRDTKMNLTTLIARVAHNAAYQTRRRITNKLLGIDSGIDGFKPYG
jgi:hypothetical protein